MAMKRKVNNLLALAVLSVIIERPMHRYEIAAKIRERGKDRDMDVKWGSLYTVVQNMEKAGFLAVVGNERDGARPERTIYAVTDAGRAEMVDWARELIADPQAEHHRFVAGLSVVAVLPPDDVVELFGRRVEALSRGIDAASIGFLSFVALAVRLIGARQHSEGIAFIVGNRQVLFQRFNHLGCLSRLLILLCEAKQNAAVDRIVYQHLLKDVDA